MSLVERLRKKHSETPNLERAKAADRIEELEGIVRELPDFLNDVLLSYHEAMRNEWRKRAHDLVDKARAALEDKP